MKKPRVLLFDIEISPSLGYSWTKWETNIIAYAKEWELLSVAWKWVGESKLFCLCRKDFDCKDDKALAVHIHRLFNESDIIVAHNGNQFDIKKSRARFLYHKLKPTKIITSIDTKLVAKRYFSFNSNSLDDLGQHLGLGRKVKHEGFDLWLKCMAGDSEAWERMRSYNLQDVALLEKVYMRFLPYIQNHPSMAKLQEREGCPNCGSSHVTKKGVRGNASGLRQQMQCQACFGWYLTRYKVIVPQKESA
jgi:hypothetical protein